MACRARVLIRRRTGSAALTTAASALALASLALSNAPSLSPNLACISVAAMTTSFQKSSAKVPTRSRTEVDTSAFTLTPMSSLRETAARRSAMSMGLSHQIIRCGGGKPAA
jgi:hypothetical protein